VRILIVRKHHNAQTESSAPPSPIGIATQSVRVSLALPLGITSTPLPLFVVRLFVRRPLVHLRKSPGSLHLHTITPLTRAPAPLYFSSFGEDFALMRAARSAAAGDMAAGSGLPARADDRADRPV
jgi:hypothetical protein